MCSESEVRSRLKAKEHKNSTNYDKSLNMRGKIKMKAKTLISTTLKKNIAQINVIVFLVIISSVLGVVGPLLFKYVIDVAIPNKDIKLLVVLLVLMILTPLMLVIMTSVKNYFSASLGEKITRKLREECLYKCTHSKFDEYKRIPKSQILNRITRECGKIGDVYITNDLTSIVSESVLLISIITTMFILNFKLSILCLIAFPISFFITWFVSKKSKSIDSKMKNLYEFGYVFISETLNMIRKIKLKNGYDINQKKWNKWLNDYKKIRLKSFVVHNFNRFLMGDLITYIIYGFILFYASVQVINSNMLLGELVTFVAFIPKVYTSLRKILNIKVSSALIHNSLAKIDEILDLPQEREDGKEVSNINSIEFLDVCFSHKESGFYLNNISFTVSRGEKFGILGVSGGGKSTIVDLIVSIYEPEKGDILFNNISLNKLNINLLRSKIAIVTQDNSLFNDTILNNIIYPNTNYESNITKVLKVVALDEFIKKIPMGIETKVGENGNNLSGGEKQRVSIANALIGESDVIILDEFTSALDVDTERTIIESILNMKNKIVIMVTHRIYSLQGFDEVMVLNNGEVVELGNPKELNKNKLSIFNKMNEKLQNY